MARGHCPDCERAGRDSLREITPTDDWFGISARRWRIVMHSDGAGKLCPGSGRKV